LALEDLGGRRRQRGIDDRRQRLEQRRQVGVCQSVRVAVGVADPIGAGLSLSGVMEQALSGI